MSGLNWGVGDILAVTKLAWDLYHNCFLVAKEAPDDFRQLVNELAQILPKRKDWVSKTCAEPLPEQHSLTTLQAPPPSPRHR